nr:hypothetical protein CFP56_22036 [Quercus suber]
MALIDRHGARYLRIKPSHPSGDHSDVLGAIRTQPGQSHGVAAGCWAHQDSDTRIGTGGSGPSFAPSDILDQEET